MQTIDTVNVVEYSDDSILGMKSWEENEAGNKEAETTFKDIIKEHDLDVTEAELDVFVEDGFHEQGDYQIFLVHSS